MRLLPEGQTKLKTFMENKFKDSSGNTVYTPNSWIYNGVHMDAYEWNNEYGTAGDEMQLDTPLFQRTKWGEDRINGYTTDVAVYPTKSAEFDHVADVDYETRTATVHYTTTVEERTHITSLEAYQKSN